jgi:hypothetical protein
MLAVAAVVAHPACGLRGILLAHGMPAPRADRIAAVTIVCGALLAVAIISGMLGVHLAAWR